MLIDRVVNETKIKKNPCIVGLDPEWDRLPNCYKEKSISRAEDILNWAIDVIDSIKDIVIGVKLQMAFYEMYGADGLRVFAEIVKYAHSCDLLVIDDSKRNDIGNTVKAYAYAHLSKEGPINSDFMTVSPFLGTDSIQPFVDMAVLEDKGVFILVKTSNPSSEEISEAINGDGVKISHWLAEYINEISQEHIGNSGYSAIGAVVGATYPREASYLRKIMRLNYFLVPGFGAQGANAKDIVSCFNEDGLGALINSSRGIIYKHLDVENYDGSVQMYKDIVRKQARKMQQDVYEALKMSCKRMEY